MSKHNLSDFFRSTIGLSDQLPTCRPQIALDTYRIFLHPNAAIRGGLVTHVTTRNARNHR